MCLNENCSIVRVGKHLCDIFPITNGLKLGDALSPLPLNFALECVIRSFQVKQGGLKLNSTHQLLIFADDVNILGGNLRTIEGKNLLVASKEIGMKTNADKPKCTFMSQDQNAGLSHNIKLIIVPLKGWRS